jgi:hypothetical protein
MKLLTRTFFGGEENNWDLLEYALHWTGQRPTSRESRKEVAELHQLDLDFLVKATNKFRKAGRESLRKLEIYRMWEQTMPLLFLTHMVSRSLKDRLLGRFVHQCPCCDYFTLPARGRRDVCAVCRWRDDGQTEDYIGNPEFGPDGMWLSTGRKNYQDLGVSNPEEKHIALPPGLRAKIPHRPRDWRTEPTGLITIEEFEERMNSQK